MEAAEEKELLKRVRELEWEVTQLQHDLIHDPLTGLKTRAYFEEQIGVYLNFRQTFTGEESSKRREQFGFKTLSLLFFDIDHFKKVNDTYGHDMGDSVLQSVAGTIKASLREGDTVARWGGEEMVASLLGASEEEAALKADMIREKIRELTFPEAGLSVTISIGVAEAGDEDLHSMIRRADKALYAAKGAGRNKVVRYSELKS